MVTDVPNMNDPQHAKIIADLTLRSPAREEFTTKINMLIMHFEAMKALSSFQPIAGGATAEAEMQRAINARIEESPLWSDADKVCLQALRWQYLVLKIPVPESLEAETATTLAPFRTNNPLISVNSVLERLIRVASQCVALEQM